MSKADIKAGQQWSPEIFNALERSSFGIVCLTPDNLQAEWLLFEAGAIAKHVGDRLTPYLHGLEPSDVKQPLGSFQAVKANKSGTHELLISLNESFGKLGLERVRLNTAFEKFWPDLESALQAIPTKKSSPAPERSLEDMVKELLEMQRFFARRLQGVEFISPESNRGLKRVSGSSFWNHPVPPSRVRISTLLTGYSQHPDEGDELAQ